MHIDDYLKRIGATADAPSPAALAALHERHLCTVPFVNLDIRRGVPLSLDDAKLLDKIVRQRRGGLCFELNMAFAWLLRGLGYRVSLASGDLASDSNGFGPSGHHMLLLVDFERDDPRHVVDVGYGPGFLRPLRLEPDVVIQQRNSSYRVLAEGEVWLVQRADVGSEAFKTMYRFTATPRSPLDFESACVYMQHAPESIFRQKFICSVVTPEGRVYLHGNRLLVTMRGQRSEIWIRGDADMRQALRKHFGITLGPTPR